MWLCEKIGENLRYEDSYVKFWRISLNEKSQHPKMPALNMVINLLQIY